MDRIVIVFKPYRSRRRVLLFRPYSHMLNTVQRAGHVVELRPTLDF